VSELPRGIPPARAPTPRDSASTVVLRDAGPDGWEVLLGLRSRRSRFMPGHLACPGGGLEAADRPGEPGAFRRCAGRELEEETGIEVAVAEWIEAGERITPPLFPVRFRTRFFVARLPEAASVEGLAPATPENDEIRLARPDAVIEQWQRGAVKLPPPTLAILRALRTCDGRSLDEVAACLASANAEEERAPRIEFTPGHWMLPLRTETLPPASHTNAWLPGGRRFVVVDPGSSDVGETARLLEVVARRCALGHRPEAVVLTHHHRDHVRGAGPVARALAIPVRAHRATFERLGGALDGVEREEIADGDTVDLDGVTLEACHTPGHAAGHLAFHVVEERLLIAGDLVSGLSTILIDPDDGDMDAYRDSLSRADRLGCRMLLPGHGPPLPGKKLGALIEHRARREARILEALARGAAPVSRIAGEAYAETPGLPEPLTASQTQAHLFSLERRARVERVDREGGSWRLAGSSP